MLTFVAVLLCICTTIVISMWLCIGGQITNMYKRVDDIKRVVDLADINDGNHYIWLKDYIGTVNDHLTTEIACLATKNNEDIKRSKEGFQVGDVIAYAGEETLVLDRETVTLNNREELTDYIIWNVSKGIQHEAASHLEHNAIFLRRASLNG